MRWGEEGIKVVDGLRCGGVGLSIARASFPEGDDDRPPHPALMRNGPSCFNKGIDLDF